MEQIGKVIAVCPVCQKKYRVEDHIIATQYIVFESDDKTSPSFHKICCLECGIEFFPKEVLTMMKKRTDESKIIVAGGLN